MKTFSFRRMMLFSRLQMVEMFGRNIGRSLRVGSSAILVICLFSLIISDSCNIMISFAICIKKYKFLLWELFCKRFCNIR